MKFLAAISAVLLLTFLAFSTPAFSQEDKDRAAQQDDRSKDSNNSNDRDKREHSRPDERAARQDRGARQDQGTKATEDHATRNQGARPDEARHDEARPDARQENRSVQQGNRDRDGDRNNNDREMREQEQRSDSHRVEGRRVERIPEDRFRASFGREHRFHVDRERVYSQPQPIVVYGGYSFQLLEPWPSDWSYQDDCYVDYDDGQYWLYDANRPGMRVTVIVFQ
jgi:hypothetical protein